MRKPLRLNRHELAMLNRRPYRSVAEVSAASKWPPIVLSTLLFAGINVFVVWILANYGEGYAILALLGSMLFTGVVGNLDVLGLLNSRRVRSNMNGNLATYVLLYLFLLLFPAVAAANRIQMSLEARRMVLLCLAPIPIIVGFLVALIRDRRNIRRVVAVVTFLNESNQQQDDPQEIEAEAPSKD